MDEVLLELRISLVELTVKLFEFLIRLYIAFPFRFHNLLRLSRNMCTFALVITLKLKSDLFLDFWYLSFHLCFDIFHFSLLSLKFLSQHFIFSLFFQELLLAQFKRLCNFLHMINWLFQLWLQLYDLIMSVFECFFVLCWWVCELMDFVIKFRFELDLPFQFNIFLLKFCIFLLGRDDSKFEVDKCSLQIHNHFFQLKRRVFDCHNIFDKFLYVFFEFLHYQRILKF